MVDGGSAATAMLGLPGFVFIAVSELDDEIEQAIQSTQDMVGCPGGDVDLAQTALALRARLGVVSMEVHDSRGAVDRWMTL